MVPLATWVDDPTVWAVIFLFGSAVLAAQLLGRLRARRERQRMKGRRSEVPEIEPITPPEQLFTAQNTPAQVSSTQKTAENPVPALTWPTDGTSLAAAVVAQLGHRHQTLPDRGRFFHALSLLGTSLEAGGVHFDQLFCDAEGVPWDVHQEIIAFLQERGEAQLAEALQCAMSWRHFQFGDHRLAGANVVLNGEVLDLADDRVPEYCCDAAMISNPHIRFFPMLHVVLAGYFEWQDAPEDKSYNLVSS